MTFPHSYGNNYFDEWRTSAVDDLIIALNVRSLEGDEGYRFLVPDPYKASGKVHPDAQWRWLRQRYKHIEQGGWWCSGLDPLNNWQPREWGCFKPNSPRRSGEGKTIKYEHSPGEATRAFFLSVGQHIWQRIAEHYHVALPEQIITTSNGEAVGFWAWVIQNNLPIVITEGAKKAASLLTAGYAAIALPGIWNGRRVLSDSTAVLIPELKLFATQGRLIYFCFDRDTKPKTIAAVNSAIAKTGKLLVDAGCTVRVITWNLPYQEKGVDDFIFMNGTAAFDEVYKSALSLQQWQWTKRQERSLTYTADVVLNVSDLDTIDLQLPESGIVAIRSAKGTGKTKLISQVIAQSERLLSLTHRIFLGRSLSERLGYTWRTDADTGAGYFLTPNGQPTERIGSCVESLLAIDPQKFAGCDLVIDEVCQVLRNLLTSNTCNRDGMRPALLARLRWLIKIAKRIIIADADLDNFTLNFIQALRGEDGGICLVRNDYQSAGYSCNIYDSPNHGAIVEYAVSCALAHKKIFIATDSKAASEVVAEEMVAQGVKSDRILVVNGDTSGEKQQREYISQINSRVDDYDVVIATGSMSTGVSIEIQWFDEVIGIFYGVVPDSDIAQALARVRDPIPRSVWVANQGKNFSKVSKSEYPFIVKRALKTQWSREVALIRSSLNPDLVPFVDAPIDWDNCPYKQLWAQTVACNNFSMWNLRDCLIARLKHEGNQVRIVRSSADLNFKTQIKETRQQLDTAHHLAVAAASILPTEQKERLESKEGLSVKERLDLEKTAIAEFACTDKVTPELVAVYPDLVTAIPRYEDLRYNLAVERDSKAIARQVKWKQGLFVPDIPVREQERFLRERLGLLQWIDRLQLGQTLSNEDLEPLGQLVRNYCRQVNEVLRLGFSPDSGKWSNVRIFNKLVKQLGVPTKTERTGKAKVTTTALDLEQWELVQGILERREVKRQLLQEKELPQSPVATEMKQHQGDIVSYIYKQVSMSPQTNVTPDQCHPRPEVEAERTFTQEEIQDGASLLMMADTLELTLAVFNILRGFGQRAIQAIWNLIPRDKRAELWRLAGGGENA
jgi:hypothetical protein